MRLPRLTTRRLMALVAAVALSLCGARLWLLRVAYQRRAALHADRVDRFRALERETARLGKRGDQFQAELADLRSEAERHAEMKLMYERAASRPWLPVPPRRSERK